MRFEDHRRFYSSLQVYEQSSSGAGHADFRTGRRIKLAENNGGDSTEFGRLYKDLLSQRQLSDNGPCLLDVRRDRELEWVQEMSEKEPAAQED